MNLKHAVTTLFPLRPLSGRARFVVVAMVLALGIAFELAPDSVIYGEDTVHYFLAAAVIAAVLAYLLQFVFSMFRWVLAGYEEGARRQFLPFLLLLLAVAAVAIFAGMFRHESSPPMWQAAAAGTRFATGRLGTRKPCRSSAP